jgi:GTPase
MLKSLPIVAIVGLPNAGKSTFLNKVSGQSLAVTSDVPGTTRDRQYLDTEWNGSNFTLVDTAGFSPNDRSELQNSLNRQIEIALDQADAVILIMDGKQPPNALGQASLRRIKKIKKPLLLAVNKLDSPKTREEKLSEFKKLGIKPLFAISSLTGLGLGDLLDDLVEELNKTSAMAVKLSVKSAEALMDIKVSIVGKPNVGKSSIFNSLLKEERVVVSPTPGTTRTAIDSRIKIGDIDYTFIDTAGLKKKDYNQAQPDVFAGFQTFKSIRRSDVCFFVIDANDEITKQDQRIASEIFAMQKGCIILANKCDLLSPSFDGKNLKQDKNSKDNIKSMHDDSYKTARDHISHHFPFLWMSPLFFVSAVTGQGLDQAVNSIGEIYKARNKQVESDKITEFLDKKLITNPPKLLRDQKKPKVFGLQQTEINPPTFELKVNHPAAISQQFRKYLENSIIKELGFWGTPINLKLKGKDKA